VASMTASATNQGFVVPVADLCSAVGIFLCPLESFRKEQERCVGDR
jgi:hypothetical protein